MRQLRDAGGTRVVVLRGVGELQVTQGDSESLEIEAEPRLLPQISTRLQQGVLYIETQGSISTVEPLRYRLTVRALDTLRIAGSAHATAGPLRADTLTLTLDGSVSAHLEGLQARSLKVSMTGASRAEIGEGSVDEQELAIHGAGSYGAELLASRHVTANIGGSGRASVSASEALDAEVSGGASLHYRGRPRLTRTVHGAASITRLGD